MCQFSSFSNRGACQSGVQVQFFCTRAQCTQPTPPHPRALMPLLSIQVDNSSTGDDGQAATASAVPPAEVGTCMHCQRQPAPLPSCPGPPVCLHDFNPRPCTCSCPPRPVCSTVGGAAAATIARAAVVRDPRPLVTAGAVPWSAFEGHWSQVGLPRRACCKHRFMYCSLAWMTHALVHCFTPRACRQPEAACSCSSSS